MRVGKSWDVFTKRVLVVKTLRYMCENPDVPSADVYTGSLKVLFFFRKLHKLIKSSIIRIQDLRPYFQDKLERNFVSLLQVYP